MGQYANGYATLTDGVSPVHIKCTSVDFPTNAEVTDDESGSLYVEAQSLTGFAPVATLTTKAISTALSEIDIDGVCVGAGKPLTEVDVYSRLMETCKESLAGTDHMKWACTSGLIRLGTLTADRNVDATITMILDTFTDSSGNAPVAETDGVDLPTPLVNQRYRLGLCKIANVDFPEIEGISLDWGITLSDKTPAFGYIWPDSAGVLTIRPVLTFTGRDLAQVKSGLIELGATGATHANTLIQLVKLVDGGSFVSFAVAEHITLTIAGLAVPESLLSVSGQGNAINTIRIPLQHDGTNVPILQNLSALYDTTP